MLILQRSKLLIAKNKYQFSGQVNKWLKANINAENRHINQYCKATLIPGTR